MLGKDEVAALDNDALLDAWITHKPVANDNEQNLSYSLLLESALIHRFGPDYNKQVEVYQGAPADVATTSADIVAGEAPAFSSWHGSFAALDRPDRVRVSELVEKGRAIIGTRAQIEQRLGTTKLIALIKETSTGKIVACGAVKDNGPEYRAMNFASAGVALSGCETAGELGYVVVDSNYRGRRLSPKVAELLIAQAGGTLYATTDDDRMKRTLLGHGFNQAGEPWDGARGKLSLWLRPDLTPPPGSEP